MPTWTTYEKWSMVVAALSLGAAIALAIAVPMQLSEREGPQLTSEPVTWSAWTQTEESAQSAGRKFPDSSMLAVWVENEGRSDLTVAAGRLTVGEVERPADGIVVVRAGEEAEVASVFKLAPGEAVLVIVPVAELDQQHIAMTQVELLDLTTGRVNTVVFAEIESAGICVGRLADTACGWVTTELDSAMDTVALQHWVCVPRMRNMETANEYAIDFCTDWLKETGWSAYLIADSED